MHPVAAVVAVAAIAPLAVTAPVFGFAALSAALALMAFLTHESAKLRAERGFFARGELGGTASVRIRSAAFFNAAIRALTIGLLALFTFPPKDAAEVARGGALSSYGTQIDAERVPTLILVYLTIGLGTLVALVVAQVFRARVERWSLYRLGLLFGLIFSALVAAANAQSDRIVAAFPTPPESAALTLYDPPQTLAVLAAMRTLHGELSAAERERSFLDQRSQECTKDFWLDLYDLRERLNRAAWRCDDLRTASDPVPIARSAIFTMAVFDDLIDGLIADIAGSLSETFSPNGGPVSSAVRVLVSVVLSSNLLQGFVLAVYIAPLTGAVRRIRPLRLD